MSNTIFSDPTMQGLQFALNSLSQRQEVLANNIANAQTPGFIAQDVSFESQLASVMNGSSESQPTSQAEVVDAPDLSTTADGNTVSMESQMSKITETNLLYGALTQLTADRIGIMNTAITG